MATLGIFASQITVVPTLTPSITSVSYTPGTKLIPAQYSVTVRNNDPATATIYADLSTNPPTTSRGSVAYNNLFNFTIEGANAPQVIYVRALASGKTYSNVTSYFQDI